nr:hypothetical protein [Tanacetum cinerariifolium]
MHSIPSSEPMVSYFNDLDFFKDFENEFPTIVYNDALTSKSDFLTELTASPQHIDEFYLKDETSLFKCDEEEQNVLSFNDLFLFNVIYPDDSKSDKDNDGECYFLTISQKHPSIANTPVLPTEDPKDSLIMGNEELKTIPEKELDEFTKSSVEDLVPILKEKAMTFSNHLFNSNDNFNSIDDELLSDEDVPEDKNIKSKDSYDSNLDEPDLLVTPLSNANKNKCFDSGGDDDEINVLDCEDSYYDSEGDILYLESFLIDDLVYHYSSIPTMSVSFILEGFTDESPLKENDELFDLEHKNDDWKKILYGAPILLTKDKVLDPGIHDQIFSNICELTLYGLPLSFLHICCSDFSSSYHLSGGVSFSSFLRKYHRLKTKQKRVFTGSFRSRVLNNQDQDKVVKRLRACHWKEHEKSSPTLPSDFIGPARSPFYGPDQPS